MEDELASRKDGINRDDSSDGPFRMRDREALMTAVREFTQRYAPSPHADLLEQMIYTVCRLSKDATGRGELKILNHALKELRLAFRTFAPYAHIRKVSIFGSARTPEGHPQYEEARKFAERIQAAGWMVITGAGNGIMRAGHHGATREASFGVSINLPFEQSANDFIRDDPKLIKFKYFFTRKLMFVKEANAIVLFPGGFGTQDEGFEALTLVQTGKSHMVPIILCDAPGGTYWHHWRAYVESELLAQKLISPQDMDLFELTDRAEDAVQRILRFYRRYHSSRFVREKFVMRMLTPLTPAGLARINREFRDILAGGGFEQTLSALPAERGEFEDMPRLVFEFDRKSMGRLRKLIDVINMLE